MSNFDRSIPNRASRSISICRSASFAVVSSTPFVAFRAFVVSFVVVASSPRLRRCVRLSSTASNALSSSSSSRFRQSSFARVVVVVVVVVVASSARSRVRARRRRRDATR